MLHELQNMKVLPIANRMEDKDVKRKLTENFLSHVICFFFLNISHRSEAKSNFIKNKS